MKAEIVSPTPPPNRMQKAALATGVASTELKEPHYVPESSELVKSLLDAYHEETGLERYCIAIGGGTYARHLKEGVAFGMMFPGEPELAHQANENIDVANYLKAARIYAYAIVALCA